MDCQMSFIIGRGFAEVQILKFCKNVISHILGEGTD